MPQTDGRRTDEFWFHELCWHSQAELKMAPQISMLLPVAPATRRDGRQTQNLNSMVQALPILEWGRAKNQKKKKPPTKA